MDLYDGYLSLDAPQSFKISRSAYNFCQSTPATLVPCFGRPCLLRSRHTADLFLVGLTATLGLTVLCTSGSASAEEGGALGLPMMLNAAAAADEPGDIFSWVAQNAALETAWIALIGVAIASVALGDPKR